jgi:hypothetical protein
MLADEVTMRVSPLNSSSAGWEAVEISTLQQLSFTVVRLFRH